MVAQQFATFLVDRLSVHVGEIKSLGKENPEVQKTTSEMELHISELQKLIGTLFDEDQTPQPPASNRRGGNRRGGDTNV